jgi:copper chaperone NosL
MLKRPRVLLALASVLLLLALPLPLWRVRLIAPQYPEGLGMEIYARTVRGATEHDLGNINELNHYIGMRAIEPEAIADFRVIPWAIVGIAAFGVLAAIIGKRPVAIAWLVAFAGVAVVGLWDFWHWEYMYGHDLDMVHAIIKVPGMSYQPPLIGAKQLLNFTATSWPAAGTLLVGMSFAIGAVAVFLPRRSRTTRAAAHGARPLHHPAVA